MSSRAAANSAPTAGIHHCVFDHGLRVFFCARYGPYQRNTIRSTCGGPHGPRAVGGSTAGVLPALCYRLPQSSVLLPASPDLAAGLVAGGRGGPQAHTPLKSVLPEAPASANVYITLAGRKVLSDPTRPG